MLKWILLVLICSASNLLASNTTQPVRPLECLQADADLKNLNLATTFATVWYVVPYRVLPPMTAMIRGFTSVGSYWRGIFDTILEIEPQVIKKKSWLHELRILFGLKNRDDVMKAAPSRTKYTLMAVSHTGSIISFVVPLYWINRSYHSQAECQHALDFQAHPNTTAPLSCYEANAKGKIFSAATWYAFGLSVGAYTLLPIVFKMLASRCSSSKSARRSCLAGPLSESLTLGATMTGAVKSFIDSAEWTPFFAFLVPLWGWNQWGNSQAKCDYDRQFNVSNTTAP